MTLDESIIYTHLYAKLSKSHSIRFSNSVKSTSANEFWVHENSRISSRVLLRLSFFVVLEMTAASTVRAESNE